VIADNRSLSCNGVGVTTGAIRLAALSMSAAHSGDPFGLLLSSADTDQWCHASQQAIQLTGVSTNSGIWRSVFFW
jgi:hypothetical protein